MKTLVLGGGGPLGIAWEAGLAAGLADGGVFLAEADRIIGTSAGAFVGAQLASGRAPQSLADAQIALGRKEAAEKNAKGIPKNVFVPPDIGALLRLMMSPLAAGESEQDRRIKLGALALSTTTVAETDYLSGFGKSFGAWPARFACTAVDVITGELTVFEQGGGYDLRRGVAASCAIPGVFPTVELGSARYMDGGVRSATCIDLAAGSDRVMAVAVVGDLGRERQMARITLEIASLGSTPVELVTPDAQSIAAFGPNPMDPSGRAEVALAGLAQGRREAERLVGFWSSKKPGGLEC